MQEYPGFNTGYFNDAPQFAIEDESTFDFSECNYRIEEERLSPDAVIPMALTLGYRNIPFDARNRIRAVTTNAVLLARNFKGYNNVIEVSFPSSCISMNGEFMMLEHSRVKLPPCKEVTLKRHGITMRKSTFDGNYPVYLMLDEGEYDIICDGKVIVIRDGRVYYDMTATTE